MTTPKKRKSVRAERGEVPRAHTVACELADLVNAHRSDIHAEVHPEYDEGSFSVHVGEYVYCVTVERLS